MEASPTTMLEFVDLPMEIQELIAVYMEVRDLCAFRASCQSARNAAIRPFVRLFEHLRHVMSYHSLRALVEITAHPALSPWVKSVHISDILVYGGYCLYQHSRPTLFPQQYKRMVLEARDVGYLIPPTGDLALVHRYLISAFHLLGRHRQSITVGVYHGLEDGYGAKRLRYDDPMGRICVCETHSICPQFVLRAVVASAMATDCRIAGWSIHADKLEDLGGMNGQLDVTSLVKEWPSLDVTLVQKTLRPGETAPIIGWTYDKSEILLQGLVGPDYRDRNFRAPIFKDAIISPLLRRCCRSLVLKDSVLDGRMLCKLLHDHSATLEDLVLDRVLLRWNDWRRLFLFIISSLSLESFTYNHQESCYVHRASCVDWKQHQPILEEFGSCHWTGAGKIKQELGALLERMARHIEQEGHGHQHCWTPSVY